MSPTVPAALERPRVAVVASLASSLVNFRLELLRALAARAHVLTIAPERHEATERTLREIGVEYALMPMARTGIDPRRDIATLRALYRLFRSHRPDVVVPYTMKPIIYGCMAARLAGVPKRYALCTGLGYAFTDGSRDARKSLVRALSVPLYRAALRGAEGIFVYNENDAAVFREQRLTSGATWIRTVPGSGVDLARYAASPPPDGPPVFLMIARLLRDKGVREYAAAARMLKASHPAARCLLVGPFDANPTAVTRDEVEAWVGEGIVEYGGAVDDVRPHLASCSVFVLPSYREGMSRTVLEAMASGRAVITSDAPGCAEPVREGRTGFIAKVGDGRSLHAAMARFADRPELVAAMGARARRDAERRFNVHAVNQILLDAMGLADRREAQREAACSIPRS